MSPTSVPSVLGVVPLREFGEPRPGRVALLISQMVGQFGLQPSLQYRFDQLGQQPPSRSTPPSPVHLGHQVVQQTSVDHLVDRLPGRAEPDSVDGIPNGLASCCSSVTVTWYSVPLRIDHVRRPSDTPW
jgi:hypothetical protein